MAIPGCARYATQVFDQLSIKDLAAQIFGAGCATRDHATRYVIFRGELSFERGGDVLFGDVCCALFLTARAVTGAGFGAVSSARRASIVIVAFAFPR